jgi:hypothetical protein
MSSKLRLVTVVRLHLKKDASARLALCGIFPQENFKLVGELPKLSKEEQAALCKVCLKAVEHSRTAGLGR